MLVSFSYSSLQTSKMHQQAPASAIQVFKRHILELYAREAAIGAWWCLFEKLGRRSLVQRRSQVLRRGS
jgi:hypothetical protein